MSLTHFVKLCPLLSKFKNITALDLSCNVINLFQSDQACDRMADLFSELPELVRLDISNNVIRGKLRRILTCVAKPLQYLKINACGLTLTDMTYLAVSHHTENLQELDISENGLGNCLTALVHLLKNIQPHVCVLEIEDASLTDAHSEALAAAVKNLKSLMYFNMLENMLTKNNMCLIGQSVASLSHLQFMCLSYPSECYGEITLEEQAQKKRDFAAEFGDVIYQEQRRLGIPNRIPNIVFSEF